MEKSLFPRLKAKLERAEKEKETLECSQKALDNWQVFIFSFSFENYNAALCKLAIQIVVKSIINIGILRKNVSLQKHR